MKATGIVRRIDDLGRIVIPKEIRRSLKIREGDPFEIYTNNDGSVTFKKYSPLHSFHDFASQLCHAMEQIKSMNVVITDNDSVIAASRGQHLVKKMLSDKLSAIIHSRFIWITDGDDIIYVDTDESSAVDAVFPIMIDAEPVGAVVILGDGKHSPDEVIYNSAKLSANFIAQMLE